MVTRKQVKLHLRSAPHSLNSQEISLAQEWASKHDIFEGQLEAHVNLPPRPDNTPPIAALGPPSTGGIRYIQSREAERIDEENDFTAPNPWLRRLGSAVHLKDFSGKKDFLRGLIAMEYEVDPDDPDKSNDAQLRFIHIAFDQLVNHAKAIITPDVIS
ncbi:hypothetical protein LZL87_013757 [Fusarium oxysporum]|nr:hypothetical protein LZL87_013757 [Fusarium oxysporum]